MDDDGDGVLLTLVDCFGLVGLIGLGLGLGLDCDDDDDKHFSTWRVRWRNDMEVSKSILQIGQRLSDDDWGGDGGGGIEDDLCSEGVIEEVFSWERGIDEEWFLGGMDELSYSEGSSVRI